MCNSFSQVIFSKYTDLLPKEVLNDDAPELQRPDEEAVKEVCIKSAPITPLPLNYYGLTTGYCWLCQGI